MSDLTAQELRRRLNYDPETGVFTWRITVNSRAIAGETAGTKNGLGYHQLTLDRKIYLAHRLAWLYMTGEWPKDQIDHRNTMKDDNRWDNLREATGTQNQGNVKPRQNCSSRFKGVYLNRGKYWVAQIVLVGKGVHLGTFDTEKEAAAAYAKAANDHFKEYARVA